MNSIETYGVFANQLFLFSFQSQTYLLKFDYEYSASYSKYFVVYNDILRGPKISYDISDNIYCLSKVNETLAAFISLVTEDIKNYQKIEIALLIDISTNLTTEINRSNRLRSGHVCTVFDIEGSYMVIAGGGLIRNPELYNNSTDIIGISPDDKLWKTGNYHYKL